MTYAEFMDMSPYIAQTWRLMVVLGFVAIMYLIYMTNRRIK